MTRYILDTNVIMRFCNPSDIQHHLATEAISRLLIQGDECLLTWIEEAELRDEDMSNGKIAGVSSQEVFNKLRASLQFHHAS